jgi:TetR/AcrR family transcriptional regulator, regulator of cefoperazone and chloramphenicol sensitivity
MTVENTTSSHELCHQTRQRLLEVAGEVFAEFGYRATTIREICRRAGTNIASVNYHFRDKAGLYAACLQYWFAEAMKKYPPDQGVTLDSTPEQRLRAFVRSFLFRILDQGRPTWHGKLLARNMIEETPFLNTCVDQWVKPMADRLTDIIRGIAGAGLDDVQVRQAGLSIVGQIVFHRHAAPMIAKVFHQCGYSHAELERLADHITDFSLAGLREMARAHGKGVL